MSLAPPKSLRIRPEDSTSLRILSRTSLARTSVLRALLLMFDGLSNQLFQSRQVDVGEAFDIQAGPADAVLAEFLQEFGVTVKAGHDVQREILFAGREAYQRPISFAAAGILVPRYTKTHDAAAPHARLGARGFFHQPGDRKAILAGLWIGDLLDKAVDALSGGLGLCFGHLLLLILECADSWSALTRHRFIRLRLVAASIHLQSGDKSPHSKDHLLLRQAANSRVRVKPQLPSR